MSRDDWDLEPNPLLRTWSPEPRAAPRAKCPGGIGAGRDHTVWDCPISKHGVRAMLHECGAPQNGTFCLLLPVQCGRAHPHTHTHMQSHAHTHRHRHTHTHTHTHTWHVQQTEQTRGISRILFLAGGSLGGMLGSMNPMNLMPFGSDKEEKDADDAKDRDREKVNGRFFHGWAMEREMA